MVEKADQPLGTYPNPSVVSAATEVHRGSAQTFAGNPKGEAGPYDPNAGPYDPNASDYARENHPGTTKPLGVLDQSSIDDGLSQGSTALQAIIASLSAIEQVFWPLLMKFFPHEFTNLTATRPVSLIDQGHFKELHGKYIPPKVGTT